MMEQLIRYFPELTDIQADRLRRLSDLYIYWNERINVISRKDIQELYLRHVLHSLAIAKVIQFKPETDVLDIGTGGGFPGIPLAILFPGTRFHLVDSIAKKIKVVQEVATALELKNVKAEQLRAETTRAKYDFITARAVTNLKLLYGWTEGKYKKHSLHDIDNGLLALKGGDVQAEVKESGLKGAQIFPINDYFSEEFFKEKYLVHIPADLN